MKEKEIKILSKFLSLVLRHKPEILTLTLDEGGWADVEELINKSQLKGVDVSLEKLRNVVETNDKRRFSFSEDLKKIRANQGHSLKVNLGLTAKVPPEILFHGTAVQNIDSIKLKGIMKGNRHHVHLSADVGTAKTVGARYGKPVVLKINAEQMQSDGFVFYQSENGVWLTEHVPNRYIVTNLY